MKTKPIGEYSERLATLYRILQTAVMAMEEVENLPDEVQDGVLERQLKKLIADAHKLCGQATLRMIAYAEAIAPAPKYRGDGSAEDEFDEAFINEWHECLYDHAVDTALRRLREAIPPPVPMVAIVRAMLKTWDECQADDKIEMVNDAMGIDADKLAENMLFATEPKKSEVQP